MDGERPMWPFLLSRVFPVPRARERERESSGVWDAPTSRLYGFSPAASFPLLVYPSRYLAVCAVAALRRNAGTGGGVIGSRIFAESS